MKKCAVLVVAAIALGSALSASAEKYQLPSQRTPAPELQRQRIDVSHLIGTGSLLTNMGFESNGGAGTNSFSGWTVVDQAGGNGSWFAQTGTAAPISGLPVFAPIEGSFQAMSDQTGPGSHVLYQDVALPSGSPLTLVFVLQLRSSAAITVPPSGSLDYTVTPNQQFRVDVMDPAAGDFDVATGVLKNVYRTETGTSTSVDQIVTADLSAFAGRTVRIRFAEADNQSFFNVGIDAVSIVTGAAIPAAGTSGLLALGLATALAGAFAVSRLTSGR